MGTDIIAHLSKLSSIGEELDAEQRLQIFRDFFRADEPQCVPFDMKAFAKKGSSFKDWICPQSMEFPKTASRSMNGLGGCCICRIMPVMSRMT